jgi:excisionase family DNA binding protein
MLPIAARQPRYSSASANRRFTLAEPWLSAGDIIAHLGVTKDTVHAWIAERAMPAQTLGRRWRFQTSEVDEWVRGGGVSSGEDAPTD